jgi:hypothetical protein
VTTVGASGVSSSLQGLEGRQVSVALRDGCRIDDCQLVSGPRARTPTLWLFSNGDDLFVCVDDVVDVWEVACTGRAA